MAFVGRRTAQTRLPGPGGSESSKAIQDLADVHKKISRQILLARVTVRHRRRAVLVPYMEMSVWTSSLSTNQAEKGCRPASTRAWQFSELSLSCCTGDCWNWFPSLLNFIFR